MLTKMEIAQSEFAGALTSRASKVAKGPNSDLGSASQMVCIARRPPALCPKQSRSPKWRPAMWKLWRGLVQFGNDSSEHPVWLVDQVLACS